MTQQSIDQQKVDSFAERLFGKRVYFLLVNGLLSFIGVDDAIGMYVFLYWSALQSIYLEFLSRVALLMNSTI